MPLATNNLLAVEQRLWAIALAWPGFTYAVRPGNRLRLDQLGIRWPESAKPSRAPADTPEVILKLGTARPDGKQVRTLCGTIAFDVQLTEYLWVITSGTKQINVPTQVVSELKAAMVAAGMQLGIPAIVANWTHELRQGKPSTKEEQMIWVQRIAIKG